MTTPMTNETIAMRVIESDEANATGNTLGMPGEINRVATLLEEQISLGLLRPRERLVEEELAERLQTKRHIMRQAIAELARSGLVEHRRNRGAVVRELAPAEVEQIYVVREAIETTAAGLVPIPANPVLLKELTTLQEAHDKAAAAGDVRGVYRINLLFHHHLFTACGNPFLVEALERAAQKSQGVRYYALVDRNRLEVVRSQHWEMIDALRRGDRKALVDLHRHHLLPSKTAYLEAYRLRSLGMAERP